MIIDLLLLTVTAILFLLVQVFQVITFVIPANVAISINYFLSQFRFLKGYFDIDTAFIVAGVYIDFLIVLYTWKLIKWAFAHLPWFGKHIPDPSFDDKETKYLDRTYGRRDSSGNRIN